MYDQIVNVDVWPNIPLQQLSLANIRYFVTNSEEKSVNHIFCARNYCTLLRSTERVFNVIMEYVCRVYIHAVCECMYVH